MLIVPKEMLPKHCKEEECPYCTRDSNDIIYCDLLADDMPDENGLYRDRPIMDYVNVKRHPECPVIEIPEEKEQDVLQFIEKLLKP